MGDGRAVRPSTVGDGRQAAISLTPEVEGTGSGYLLDSIQSTILKKQSSDVWVIFLGFLITCYPVLYNPLPPHGLKHARLPYPSPSPRACPNSSQ